MTYTLSEEEKIMALHYIDGIDFPHFYTFFNMPQRADKKPLSRGTLERQEEEGKVITLHYIGNIDFPFLHEPFYPSQRKQEKIILKDPHGSKLVRRNIRSNKNHQYHRG